MARSEQKNYLVTLACCAGPILLAAVFSVARIGDSSAGFLTVLGLLALGGPVAGLLLLGLLALLLRWPGAVIMRSPATEGSPAARDGAATGDSPAHFRLTAAFAAYAASPLACASVTLLPLMLGMFGTVLFGSNPPAAQVKPLPFRVLAALAAGSAIWSFILTVRSFTVVGVPWKRSSAAAAVAWGAVAALVAAAGFALRSLLHL